MKTLTPKLKKQLIALADAHQAADEYQAGHCDWRGGACSIGCTLRDAEKIGLIKNVHLGNHEVWGKCSGIGEPMAHLQDRIFEWLSETGGDAAGFTPKVLRAIRCGADYSMAWPRIAIFLLEGLRHTEDIKVKDAIDGVLLLYREWVETNQKPAEKRFAASAARAARAAG